MKKNLFLIIFFLGAINVNAQLYPASQDGLYGYKEGNGKFIITPQYTSAGSFKDGLAYVAIGKSSEKKYGFIDEKGKIVIPIKYGNANEFREGLASVTLNGKSGFIDKNDKVIIPFEFSS